MTDDVRDATEIINQLARAQHGVVSRKQLLGAGLSRRLVGSRLDQKRLIPVFPGVYELARGAAGTKGRWLAATLFCGERVALSHRSAAQLWGFEIRFSCIELVSASMRKGRINSYADRGLIVHQTRSLPDDHLDRVDGIQVTSLSRTLVDLAAVVERPSLTAIFNEADRLRMLDLDELNLVLNESKGRRGTGFLRSLAANRDPRNQLTRSELESKFLVLCRNEALPLPDVNTLIEGFEVDCAWPEFRFIVELDGLAFHSAPAAVERDHRRDATLQAKGFLVLRLTYRDVTTNPGYCAAMVRKHISRARRIQQLERQLH